MQDFITYLAGWHRRSKIALEVTLDGTLIAISFIAAMAFRLESLSFLADLQVYPAVLITIFLTLSSFHFLGLYRALVRYLTGQILILIGTGAIVSAVALYLCGLALHVGLPRSVPIMHAVLVFLSIGGLRFLARHIFRNPKQMKKRPVIIYGAGEAGLQLVNALFHGREYLPVAMVDDDTSLQHMAVGGLRVYSPADVPRLVRNTGARVILLAIPGIGRARRREVVAQFEGLNLEIKRIPGMSELISGKAKISELRTVTAEDLLGRDAVAPDLDLFQKNIAGKVVMVSGAGGSIGSELCRQVLSQQPAALVLYEMSEIALYTIEAELSMTAKRQNYRTRIYPILGSVLHSRNLEATITAFGVQTIYHAAAYKHVPLVEENVIEGVWNNVLGTLTITNAARKLGVESFIQISTDKAVRPTNIMGATKRVSELICQAQACENTKTVFSMVRFGNVLGSSGSVIPRFRTQIENGGPVTVTHNDINRYFMTIAEASQLVIQAGAMARGGDVFVLDMGEPVRIMDLAFSMVKLHGLTPYIVEHPDQVFPERGDIPVCVTGLRKGEKLFEELLIGNDPMPTQHPRIMTASEVSLPMKDLMAALDRLQAALDGFDVPAIIEIFHELPLEYAPLSETVSDILWGETQALDEHLNLVAAGGARI